MIGSSSNGWMPSTVDVADALIEQFGRLVDCTRPIATPFLVVDEAVVDENIERMQAGCAERGVKLRPHIKTHKSAELATRQLSSGAVGVTCATLSEAVGLGERGVSTSVFIAAPSYVDDAKQPLLTRAAQLHDEVLMAVDSAAIVSRLTEAAAGLDNVSVVIEVDCGGDRTGVAPADVGRLAEVCAMRIAGVFTHGGQSYAPGAAPAAAEDEVDALMEAVDALGGGDDWIVSAGSTPTALLSSRPPVNEERPGTYVFGDHQQVQIGPTEPGSVAGAVVATVIHSGDGKVVVDAGAKILTKDRQTWLDSFGHLPIAPEARVERVYDNHGVIRMAAEDVTPRVGDRITIVPNHICPVVNLLDVMVFVGADGEPFDVAVDLRGHLA